MAVEGQEHSSLTTVDVQGHRDTLSRALRFSSLMLWLLIDRSTTVLPLQSYDCRCTWTRCPRALRLPVLQSHGC